MKQYPCILGIGITMNILFWQDPEEVCYDLKYALRLCSEHNKQKACVHIYSTMGLFEEAVDLSLKVPPSVII